MFPAFFGNVSIGDVQLCRVDRGDVRGGPGGFFSVRACEMQNMWEHWEHGNRWPGTRINAGPAGCMTLTVFWEHTGNTGNIRASLLPPARPSRPAWRPLPWREGFFPGRHRRAGRWRRRMAAGAPGKAWGPSPMVRRGGKSGRWRLPTASRGGWVRHGRGEVPPAALRTAPTPGAGGLRRRAPAWLLRLVGELQGGPARGELAASIASTWGRLLQPRRPKVTFR